MSTEEKIWRFLKTKGLSDAGAAGLMGNLYAESGLRPNNLQNSYEKKLGYTDESYTDAVDNGTYTNFARDCAGYGLAQWTYWSRKAALLEYARVCKRSIGDLEMQLDFLIQELATSFPAVLATLKTATSVRAASDCVLLQFERPADQSEAAKARRAGYGQKYFDKFAQKGSGSTMGFTNSPLVNYTKLTPHCNKPRENKIDTITIHHMAGNITVETCGQVFQTRKVSANYGVDGKGRIGMYVEEANRSWASYSPENDHRAVTIEVANCGGAPDWPVSDKAYAALIELVADICKRNGIEKLVWGETKADRVNHRGGCNMTVHQDFMATACPGPYLLRKMPQIAQDVNAKLGAAPAASVSKAPYTVRVTATDLPVRKGPGMTYGSTSYIKPGVYTVTEESNGFGRLKSGAGWISLAGVKKA